MEKKINKKASPEGLAAGQLWKLNHAYIQIVELGKRLLHYRMMKNPGQRGVRPQISEIGTMWGYLKSRKAELVKG